jgi:hypothetical protein
MARVATKRLHANPQPSTKRAHRSRAKKSTGATTTSKYLVQFGLFELSPGSPIARALGCSCREHDGSEMFACESGCSIHGLDALMSTLDEGSTNCVEFDRE